MRQQTTIDAERAARTPVNPAPDARINLVDLRVGNKLETFCGWNTRVERLVIQDASVHRGGGWRTSLPGTRECGSESVARNALGRYERASEKTSKTACVHADDAHERSSTPDAHETERSSEWSRNLETLPGRMGAGTQRMVPSDADAVAAVFVCGRQRSGLGGVGTTYAAVWGRVQTRFRKQSKQQYWHTTHKIQNGGGMLVWTRRGCKGTKLSKVSVKRCIKHKDSWGIADGNDTTPMEVDALMKGKGKN